MHFAIHLNVWFDYCNDWWIYFLGRSTNFEEWEKSQQIPTMCGRWYQTTSARAFNLRVPNSRPHQGENTPTFSSGKLCFLWIVLILYGNIGCNLNFHIIKTFYFFLQQGAARIAEEEKRVRESKGEECDMTLKNNIEGIIIKWAYQTDEVNLRQNYEIFKKEAH